MHKFKIDTYLKVILLISLISLISAFFIEYVLGHLPCNLCLIERIPYLISIILILSKYIFYKKIKFIILLLILTFAFSLITSFYHFGIEQSFFEESVVCGIKDAGGVISKEELLKQLNTKIVSCKDVTFRILGFSLTAINIILSLFLLMILFKIFTNYEKFKN